MSHVMTRDDDARLTAPPACPDLRRRIGWICQTIRVGALVWIAWIVAVMVLFWGDRATMLEHYGRFLGLDLTAVTPTRYALGFALALIDCAVVGGVAFCLWQLATTYLSGRVFTVDAALWLRRTGLGAIAAVIVDVICRLAISSIFAGRLVLVPAQGLFITPEDLLYLIVALFLFSLAYIFKAAAELADDHAQIV
jgi:Protein of unknown function (DUF2975)